MTAPSTEAERIERGRTLFTRMIEARENEKLLRAAQARRDRCDELLAMMARTRRREQMFARACTTAALLALITAGLVEFIRWN